MIVVAGKPFLGPSWPVLGPFWTIFGAKTVAFFVSRETYIFKAILDAFIAPWGANKGTHGGLEKPLTRF